MTLCATICGGDGWRDFQAFADARVDCFATFLNLRHGVPSADIIREQFEDVEPDHQQTINAGHGRIEARRAWVIDQLDGLKQADNWPALRSVTEVEAKPEAPAHGAKRRRA